MMIQQYAHINIQLFNFFFVSSAHSIGRWILKSTADCKVVEFLPSLKH